MTEIGPTAAARSSFHMLRGSAWGIALRWFIRCTGLLSTLILARLLTPTDFGIVAMAMLIVGALEVLSETGQRLAIIRHPDPVREHYDSAWTMSILIGLSLSIGIFAVAPVTVEYFHEPRAVLVIRCLALRAFISGFENIGVVEFRRGLQFRNDFRYAVAQKLISFVVTLGTALVLRNYWALVIGILVSRFAAVSLSYMVHPFRPRICFSKVTELWSFSIWALIKHIGNYLTAKADEFVVGGMGPVGGLSGANALGRYNVAADVAASPTDELVAPVVATLFPVMATVQDDVDALKHLYLKVLAWSAVVCSSTSVGVALVSSEIVPLLLGDQWRAVKTIMPWIALSQGILSLGASVHVVFDVLGRPRYSALLQWGRLTLLISVLIPLSWQHDLDAIAFGRLAVACVMTPMLFWSLRRVLPLRIAEITGAIWRPLASAAAMVVVVSALEILLPSSIVARLAAKIVVGAVAYSGALLILWRTIGYPSGAEEDAIKWGANILRGVRFRRSTVTASVEGNGDVR